MSSEEASASEELAHDDGVEEPGAGGADDLEVRADHVGEDVLRRGTVTGDWFDEVHAALLGKNLVLVVGPRGCGKTHMMRYTWLQCSEAANRPLAVYVSFNRYLRLEPLLKTRSDAVGLFHTWVLARLLLALDEGIRRIAPSQNVEAASGVGLDRKRLDTLVARLERGSVLSQAEEDDARLLSIEAIVNALRAACIQTGRKRTVLLLDDAALTLAPEFLVEFFDIVRVLKRSDIAPKCSVYPGSTEYGPRFHVQHEARVVPVWLAVDNPRYREVMSTIGRLRFPEGVASVSAEVNDLLMYTAFGVPRAYLTLLRNMSSQKGRVQQALNKVIQEHRDSQVGVYRSLEQKMPRLATVVRTGEEFFVRAVEAVRQANEELADKRDEKQLQLGIEGSDFNALTSRMVNLLTEAGLLYEHPEVSHGGPDRTYRRFTPHLAALIALRAFSGRSRGASPGAIVDFIQRKPTKHPVRRKLSTLLSPGALDTIRLDLPACQNCGETRLNENQRFCHSCGTRLVDPSTFSRLMSLSISEVPNLTPWLRDKVREHGIETIRDLLAFQDPGTELRKIHRVGRSRAERVVNSVEDYVDEFLS